MFGQWALGTSPIGEPEEFPGVTPIPADAIVWFTVETSAEVAIVAETVTEQEF